MGISRWLIPLELSEQIMEKTVSRRDFLKLGGAAAGAAAVGSFVPPAAARAAREAGHLNAQGDG